MIATKLFETLKMVRQRKLESDLRQISRCQSAYREVEAKSQAIEQEIARIQDKRKIEMENHAAKQSFTIADVARLQNHCQRISAALLGLVEQKHACTEKKQTIQRQLQRTQRSVKQAKLKLENIDQRITKMQIAQSIDDTQPDG